MGIGHNTKRLTAINTVMVAAILELRLRRDCSASRFAVSASVRRCEAPGMCSRSVPAARAMSVSLERRMAAMESQS